MWRFSMGQNTVFILCIIGVLVFAPKIKAQEPRGTPGVDYPNYFTLPETSFKCSEQKFNPGFYADLETKCQAFHFCYQDRQESFLCPTGTIFNQAVLTCDAWYKSNCSLSQMFYSVNIGPVMERAGKNLPMLLRLRNRSQNKPSTQTSTSAVADKESSLYEVDKSPDETKSNALQSEASDTSYTKDNKDEETSDHTKQDSEEYGSEEIDNSELMDEGVEEEMVYDFADEGYYRNYDQSEGDWRDSELVRDEFGNYYGYNRNYEAYESESSLNDMEENESFEDSDRTAMDDLEYPEFRKRNSQVGYSRVRRKPVYFVLDDQSEGEITGAVDNEEYPSFLSNSETREGKEMNITAEESANETTPNQEPFPRPTPIPLHEREQEELSTHNPMTSEEFGDTIFRDLVEPYQGSQSDDETIYIENDLEPEAYAEFSSQYENVPESAESYESYSNFQDRVQDLSDTDDTFVVIPDEYDNVAEGEYSEMDYPEETAYRAQMDYPEETAYRAQIQGTQPVGYGTYENYQYSSNVGYPEYYGQSINYPEMTSGIYQNVMPGDQRYSYEDYEYPGQVPVNYESSSFDTENTYAVQYPDGSVYEVTERPLPLPVTEADQDSISTENFYEIADKDLTEPDQTEEVYYVLDEESSEGNETKSNENVSEESSKFDKVDNQGLDQKNSSVDESSMSNQYTWSSKSTTSQMEQTDLADEPFPRPTPIPLHMREREELSTHNPMTSEEFGEAIFRDLVEPYQDYQSDETKSSNSMNTQYGSNLGYGSQATPLVDESFSANSQSFPSNVGSFDFSADSRFLNNMGYSESMDFGPYGFGPNMGQQFSMMEPMQQSTIGNAFSHRISQSEQPKISRLSAIQEKMRTMKQGKFGAFKKYMSSTNK